MPLTRTNALDEGEGAGPQARVETTAMTLRASLEAVLRKHLQSYHDGRGVVSTLDNEQQFLDDLLAVLPQPSREALEKIINEMFAGAYIKFGSVKDMRDWQGVEWPKLLDKLMAWATGQLEQRWCEHITSTIFMGQTVWLYQAENAPNGVVFGLPMDTCPLCASPRPEE